MDDDFVIDDLSIHLAASKKRKYQDKTRIIFKSIVLFLETNSLLAQGSVLKSENINDCTKILKSDLNDIGFVIMKSSYRKWLEGIDMGKEPTDVSMLQKELRKLK